MDNALNVSSIIMINEEGLRVSTLCPSRHQPTVIPASEPINCRFSLLPGISMTAWFPLVIHMEPILGLVQISASSWKRASLSLDRPLSKRLIFRTIC